MHNLEALLPCTFVLQKSDNELGNMGTSYSWEHEKLETRQNDKKSSSLKLTIPLILRTAEYKLQVVNIIAFHMNDNREFL